MSIHENGTISVVLPVMGVFNNLVIYDQKKPQNSLDGIVAELALCQSLHADGYVGGIPEGDRLWKEVAQGDIRTQNFDLNGVWVPWYNLHKLYAGLLDSHLFCGNDEAKSVVVRILPRENF